MTKISSVSEMESELLSHSVAEDIGMLDKSSNTPPEQVADKVLSADDVRHDTSVLARILIRAWVGWPFMKQLPKRKILKELLHIYNNAQSMTTLEYFRLLGPVFDNIPDHHTSLSLDGYDRLYTRLGHAPVNVGKNIASEANNKISVSMRPDKIAVCGIQSCIRSPEFESVIQQLITEYLPQSNAVIVDLRGNGGGSSTYTDQLAYELCGGKVRSSVTDYIRNTPEACIMQTSNHNALWDDLKKTADITIWNKHKKTPVDLSTGYSKPIYILIDERTMSSAEMFCLRMTQHPMAKFVGCNSGGCEENGYCGAMYLPHSRLKYRAGMVHRELEPQYKNFELHGLTPDIMVPAGQDALEYAITDYNNSYRLQKKLTYCTQIENNGENYSF